jgi:hypothetical protein
MAANQVTDASELFQQEIGSGDVSGMALDKLFGDNWESLTQIANGTVDSSSASLMMVLLQSFSTVALSIGTVIMVYTIFVGTIGTAHEGEPLGKKLSTLWTPLRGGMAVGMLIPTAKGLNILMVFILAGVSGSVSLANYLTSQSFDFLKESGGQIAVSAPPSMRANIEDVSKQALKTLAGQHFMAYKMDHEFSDGLYKVYPPADESNQYVIAFQPPDEASADEGDMGTIKIPCTTTGGDEVCKARTNALISLIDELIPEARNMAVSVLTEQEIEYAGAPTPREIDTDALMSATDRYVSTVTPYISQIIADADPEFQEGLETFAEQASTDGWMMLGSYYWTVSRFTEHTNELAGNLPTTTQANYARLLTTTWEDPAFSALWRLSSERAEEALNARYDAAQTGTDSAWDKFNNMFNKYIGNNAINALASVFTNGDPVVAISNFGHWILVGSEGLVAFAIMGDTIASGVEGASESTWGDLVGAGTIGKAIRTAAEWAAKITVVFCGTLGVFGLFAAFYIPALPWILWMSAVIGWLILIVETLFAAPLWAVGHLIPEGEGMAGMHGRQGYMLMLGVLARPPLMVAGFFSSIIIFTAIGHVIGLSFGVFNASVTSGNFVGPVTILAQIVIVIGTMIVFSHKVFGLITHLPENVTKWIGGQASSLGEHNDESRVRGYAMVAGGTGARTASNMAKGIGAGVGSDSESDGDDGDGGGGKNQKARMSDGDLAQ